MTLEFYEDDEGWSSICNTLQANYKLPQLRNIAIKLGIDFEGTKEELCSRLAEHLQSMSVNDPKGCINDRTTLDLKVDKLSRAELLFEDNPSR